MSDEDRQEILKRVTDLKKYQHEMYGMRDIFQPAIDYGDKKDAWNEMAEILTICDKKTRDRFLEKIDCAKFWLQDRQKENILTQYDLRFEPESDTTKREKIEKLMGHNSKRRITFPFYNMELTKAQNDKLFYGITEQAKSPKTKRKKISTSPIRHDTGNHQFLHINPARQASSFSSHNGGNRSCQNSKLNHVAESDSS